MVVAALCCAGAEMKSILLLVGMLWSGGTHQLMQSSGLSAASWVIIVAILLFSFSEYVLGGLIHFPKLVEGGSFH